MAGALDLVQRGLTDLETRGGALRFDPVPLPELADSGRDPISVAFADRTVSVTPGESCTLALPS